MDSRRRTIPPRSPNTQTLRSRLGHHTGWFVVNGPQIDSTGCRSFIDISSVQPLAKGDDVSWDIVSGLSNVGSNRQHVESA